MSVGKLPEGEMPSGERLPEWVNQIRGIFEKIKGNKKIFRKLTKYARDDLEIIEKSREKGSITELPTHQSAQGGLSRGASQYWEDIRDWLHNNALFDSWCGVENIEG